MLKLFAPSLNSFSISSGLEEAQKQQAKDEDSARQTKSAFKRMLLSVTGNQETEKNNSKENKLLE